MYHKIYVKIKYPSCPFTPAIKNKNFKLINFTQTKVPDHSSVTETGSFKTKAVMFFLFAMKAADFGKNGLNIIANSAKNCLIGMGKFLIYNKKFQAIALSIAMFAGTIHPVFADIAPDTGNSQTQNSVITEQTQQADTTILTNDQAGQNITSDPALQTSTSSPGTSSTTTDALPANVPLSTDATSSDPSLTNTILDPGQQYGNAPNPALPSSSETSLLLLDAPDSQASSSDESLSGATTTADNLTELDNANNALIANQANASSTTGENNILSQEKITDSVIQTGDINVYANVLNVVNTNLFDSKISELVQNFDSLSADLFLNDPGASSQELAQDLVTKICTDVECKSLSSFTLTNQNLAGVQNDVTASGNSGNNGITAQGDVKDSTISTGDVNAVVNILNIVNSNLVNSRWTFASINIFGDWTGNLVLPSELYFTDYMAVGQADSAAVNLDNVKKVIIDAQNQNQAAIINNVNTGADTGNNGLEAVGNADQTGGDVHDSEVQTGQADSVNNIKNFANTNLVNTRWYLNLINTLGSWTGNVYHLPGEVAMSPTLGGLSFFSTTNNNNDEAYRAFANAIASMDEASTTASSSSETDISVSNENTAAIINNVDVSAETGDNGITGANIKRSKILTGNARALANVINFANTNLIGSDLQIGLVNIFGNWAGDIIFGFPDLSVSQQLASPAFPIEKNQPVNFQLTYQNLGNSSIEGTNLEWQFDPVVMAISPLQDQSAFTLPQPGVVNFNLNRLSPKSSGTINLALTTLDNLMPESVVTTFAGISGVGPESNKDNNSSVLQSLATTTIFSQGEGGGGQPGDNSSDSQNGGSSSGQNNGSGGGGSAPRANLMRVHKTNSSAGQNMVAGDKVSFTLTVDNDGINDLYNVVIYDTLRGPDNNIIYSKQFPLGKVAAREEVVVEYDLEVTGAVQNGIYTNSAYTKALDLSFQSVQSEATAISSFTVNNTGANAANISNSANNAPPDQTASSSPPVLTSNNPDTNNKNESSAFAGDVKGVSTQKPPTGSKGMFNPVIDIAEQAQASAGTNIALPELIQEKSTLSNRTSSLLNQLFSILFFCFLIAFGYASANMIKRSKQTAVYGNTNPLPEPVQPIFAAKKTAAKKTSPRPRKKLSEEAGT